MVDCLNCSKGELEVEKITVANHVKETCWPLGDEMYFFYENPECEVVYFNTAGWSIPKDDMKTKVTFKEKTAPRPLCYRKQVTEEDVIKAITNGASTFEEVRQATGIGGGGHCKVTNPAGRCCSRNYKPFIEKDLRKRDCGKSDVVPMTIQ
jgi:bacterioferritin-associated ferredoxin